MNKKYLVVAMALTVPTAAATATQIDFTDEEFEDVAYRELYSLLRPHAEQAPNFYCEGADFYEANFRLVPGRITLNDVAGNPNAYAYIGYFGPGETPTIEGLVSKSLKSYRGYKSLSDVAMETAGDPKAFRGYVVKVFPELLYTNFIILGVNLEEAAFMSLHDMLPPIILVQKRAEDEAREYFGVDDVEFVQYIWGSKVYGYEYSDGENRVIIPFIYRGSYVDVEHIYTREEVNRNIEEFKTRDEEVDDYMRGAYKYFWDWYSRTKKASAE